MARLESNAKLGYYPLPPDTLSRILGWIACEKPSGPRVAMYWTPVAEREKRCSSFISKTHMLTPTASSWTPTGRKSS